MDNGKDDYWDDWSEKKEKQSVKKSPSKSNNIKKVKKKTTTKKSKGKKNIFKGVFVLLVAAGLMIAVFFTPLLSNLQTLMGGCNIYPEKADFTIKRTIDLETNGEIDYNIDLPVPVDIPGNDIQTIQSMEWGGNPEKIEKFGQNWMLWSDTLEAYESKKMIVSYDVKTTTVDWGYSSENSGKISDVSQDYKDRYNHNQWQLEQDRDNDGQDDWMIQPSSPEIQKLAKNIVSREDNLYDKSRALYEWLNNNIDYKRGGSSLPQHSLMTLHNKEGDCDEQSFLYCSLARSIGMPAWVELGILNDRVIDSWQGHGWIRQQFVTDEGEGGWVNIDPVNHQFFARDAQRVTSWVDDGKSETKKVFNWDEVPGSSEQELIDYLNNQDIDKIPVSLKWDDSNIMKPDQNTIRVSKSGHIAVFSYDSDLIHLKIDEDYYTYLLSKNTEDHISINKVTRSHLEDYYLFLNYTYSGNPRVTYSDNYVTENMETEGQVVLGDDGSTPGFVAVILGLSILFAVMVYDVRRKKR